MSLILTAIILPPAINVLVRIAPQQIAQKSRVGHVCGSHNPLDLVQTGELRRQSPVGAENLLVDDCRAWKTVETVRKGLPQLDPEASLALIVKAVDAVDAGALMVAAQHEAVLGVLDLVREKQADRLKTLLASVDVVAEENVVGLGGEAAVLKEAQQVVVLAVDVPADLDGRLEF